MNTGNGQKDSANRKNWKGSPRAENSNIVKAKAPVKFSSKRDSFKGKQGGSK